MVQFLFGNGAAWFSVPAIIGILLFLVQMSGVMGHDDGGAGGGDAGGVGHDGGTFSDTGDISAGTGDHGGSHASSESGHGDLLAGVLSMQSAAAFAMGFGLGGFASLRGSGLGVGLSMLIGLGCGLVFVALLGFLFHQARRLSSSGNMGIGALVGHEADVTVRIPAGGVGKGEIRAVIGDRERRCQATTAGEAIAPRTHVIIERVNGDNSVLVRVASTAAPRN